MVRAVADNRFRVTWGFSAPAAIFGIIGAAVAYGASMQKLTSIDGSIETYRTRVQAMEKTVDVQQNRIDNMADSNRQRDLLNSQILQKLATIGEDVAAIKARFDLQPNRRR